MATKEKEINNQEIDFNAENTIKNLTNNKTKNCFVITPIGGENEPIRRHIDGVYDAAIVPILDEFDYTPEIPHRMSIPGSINKQIIKKIYDSDLIIANLTDINPNVMYELALRHCFNKPAIIIAEDGTELPFDINNERTIFYINDAQGIIDLKKKLKKTISDIQENDKYSSPVVSVLGEIKFEEQILERKNGTKEDGFFDSLQLILNRLDGIERDTRNNNSYKFPRTYFERISYRISSPQPYEQDIKKIISEFSKNLRERNIKYSLIFLENSSICKIHFSQLTPMLAESVDFELRTFCQHHDLDIERI